MSSPSINRLLLIGRGEVGRRLAAALERSDWEVRSITRNEGWPAAADPADSRARLVAVREEDLAEVLRRLEALPRERLVLVQNGFLEAVHGDLGRVTRGLIYFTSKGEFFRVLCASPFHGPLAGELAGDLDAGGIPAEVTASRDSFLVEMIVKGIWNAVVGLPLAVHGIDLAAYLAERRAEFEELVDESAQAAGAEYGVRVDPATAARKIVETTGELGWVRGGAKALPWRNGAIAAFGRRQGVATPVNDRLLRAVGHDPDA